MIENPDRSAIMYFPYVQHMMSFIRLGPERVFWSGAYLYAHAELYWLENSFSFLSCEPRGPNVTSLACFMLRWMGTYGGWCQKPQVGLGNWQLVYIKILHSKDYCFL